MPLRSYVDPCLYVKFLHFSDADISEEVAAKLSGRASLSNEDMAQILLAQYQHSTPVFIHETYHVWQGLRLPYLYRYAQLATHLVYRTFQELCVAEPDPHKWECLLPHLEHLSISWHIALGEKDKIRVTLAEKGDFASDEDGFIFSHQDLMESTASVAQFQLSVVRRDRSSNKAFQRWKLKEPAYDTPLRFVQDRLKDPDLGLRLFIPLVNAAFHTSQPMMAFPWLLDLFRQHLKGEKIYQTFVAQEEPCKWDVLFRQLLGELNFNATPDSDADLATKAFMRLNLEQWVGSTIGPLSGHPFLGPLAQAWIDAERSNPVYSWAIDLPGYTNEDVLGDLVYRFQAPATIIRFASKRFGNRVVLTRGPIELLTPLEILTAYSCVRRASGMFYDPDLRLCYHKDCPEYEHNYCNCFPNVPKGYHDCKFRSTLAQMCEEEGDFLRSRRGLRGFLRRIFS